MTGLCTTIAAGFDASRRNAMLARLTARLSGGMQPRVALARALVYEPRVLLLDEPLAALDKKLREEMRAELREILRAVGITTIFVTHDQGEALGLSDFIGASTVMRGRAIASDRVELAPDVSLKVSIRPAPAAGQEVELAIRPERVSIVVVP